MNELEQARQKIDQADQEIVQSLERRMEAVQKVAQYKKEHQLDVLDQGREKEVLKKVQSYVSHSEYRQMIDEIYQFIMELSKASQRKLLNQDKVAYAGIEGAFSHQVSQKLYPQAKSVPYSSFKKVIEAVQAQEVKMGIIPLENTSSGVVGEVMDLLKDAQLKIIRVVDQPIDQCLLAIPGAQLKEIEWVYSKEQSLSQSQGFLEALGVKQVSYPNTALAAQFVANEQDKTKAAIASKESASMYGLEVLACHIQSSKANTTRFLVLSQEGEPVGNDHFSFIFTVLDKPGSLNKVIQILSDAHVNMDTLQSRPIQGKDFEYFFYVQCKGTLSPEQQEDLKRKLSHACQSIHWLGSYTIEVLEE